MLLDSPGKGNKGGRCAFSSNIIDSSTKAQMCGLFSQSAAPNYKNSSSYPLTANDVIIKFSDSSLGYFFQMQKFWLLPSRKDPALKLAFPAKAGPYFQLWIYLKTS